MKVPFGIKAIIATHLFCSERGILATIYGSATLVLLGLFTTDSDSYTT